MKYIYLVCSIVGAVVPMSVFASWVLEHGLNVSLFLTSLFATPPATMFTLDLAISAFVLSILAWRGVRRGIPYIWLTIPASCLVGVSFGLPLYLYLEARHNEDKTYAQAPTPSPKREIETNQHGGSHGT